MFTLLEEHLISQKDRLSLTLHGLHFGKRHIRVSKMCMRRSNSCGRRIYLLSPTPLERGRRRWSDLVRENNP